MRLPDAEGAVVDARKVRDYLLSTSHPIGRFKAAFFMGLGYSRSSWQELARDLRELAQTEDAAPAGDSPYGRKFEVRGTLEGPSARRASIVTVWIIPRLGAPPRLVTAYPGAES
jgi:hypothetical protein